MCAISKAGAGTPFLAGSYGWGSQNHLGGAKNATGGRDSAKLGPTPAASQLGNSCVSGVPQDSLVFELIFNLFTK